MEERGLSITHIIIMRWVHQYGPELDERVRLQMIPGESMKRISK